MASQRDPTTSSFPATVNVDDVVSDPESLIRLLRAYDPAFDGAQAVRAAYEDAIRHRQGQGRGQNHDEMMMDMDMDIDSEEDHDHQSQATAFGRRGGLTGNALVDWVTAHVNSDTLLSVDEMNQYAALERAGLLPHLEATLSQPSVPGPMSDLKPPPSDPSKVPPFSDQEIRAATQELIRSTSLITRQTEALREQQEHLDRLVAEHKRDVQARAALEVQQLKGLGEQQRELVQSVVELALFLGDKVDELEAQNEDRKADVETLVDGMFHSDDHVLSSLQKLGDQLSSRSCSSGEEANKAEEEMVRSLRDVCARMIKFHVEGIRTRLDRIYLETLHAAIESGAGVDGDGGTVVTVEDVATVQRELEELYTEILPVGQMAIEHQFLRPALDDLAAKNGRSLEQSTQAAHYIDECLDYLLDRITTIRACIEEYLSHQQAVAEFAQLTRPELNTNGLLPKDPTDSSRPGASHHRRHSSFPRQLPADSLSPELKSILQTLGVPIPSSDPSTQSHLSTLQSALDSVLTDCQQKRDDLFSAAQSTFEDAVTRHIGDAKAALTMLRDSVLAESPWGAVRLVDEELEESVDVIRQELGDVEEWRASVEGDIKKATNGNEKKEAILKRWGERL